MKLIGKKVNIKYSKGNEYIVNYLSKNKLKWEGIGGRIKGYSSVEKCHIVQPSKNVFFVSWLEKSGYSISELLDFNKNKVNTFVTFNSKGKRKEQLWRGRIKIITK